MELRGSQGIPCSDLETKARALRSAQSFYRALQPPSGNHIVAYCLAPAKTEAR
jgi:hypothetical protein